MAGVIDVEALLLPIDDGVAGVGADPREPGGAIEDYLAAKDARASARLAERGAFESAADEPLRAGVSEWSELADRVAAILSGQAKDLEVAAWATEAALRLAGIGGLADGFALMAGLIERYWDAGLWPAADEDGDETRLAALFGLFGRGGPGTLLQPLKLVALSERAEPPVTLWSAELATAPAPARSPDEEIQARIDERRQAALDAVANGIGRASAVFVRALHADIVRAEGELDRLMTAIDRASDVGRFGSQVAEPLAAARRLLEDHAAGALAPEPGSDAAATGDSAAGVDDAYAPAANGTAPVSRGGVPATRDDALRSVLALADFFDRAEPQSFVGPALRDVVRRARMPVEELMAELLPDAEARTLFFQRAGIRLAPSTVEDPY